MSGRDPGLNEHMQVARAALAQGYLDTRAFFEALRAIPGERDASLEAFWVDAGRLTTEQLERLRAAHAPAAGGAGAGTTAVARFERPLAPTPPPLSERTPEPPRESRLRYQVTAVLGAGGLGEVLECFDPRLGRKVALKTPRDEHKPSGGACRILEREARIMAGLEHPNIVPVYDAGQDDKMGPYYVMRRVREPSLDTVLMRVLRGDPESCREYSLKRLLRCFTQICHAVDYAHSRGVVHCDLKPANILLGAFGQVLVVDWGLAYSTQHPAGPRGGTPGYMAPEQIPRGKRHIDARTDVFALGAILYRMLCGEEAFPHAAREKSSWGGRRREPAELLARYFPPPPPSERARERPGAREVPPEVEEICMRAIELDPARRHASASELADAVDAFLEGRAERERREEAAARLCADGDELAARYHEFDESRPEHLQALERLRAHCPPWAPVEEKQELWDAEDMLRVTDALQVRTLQAAIGTYDQALEALPHHGRSRAGLAGLYAAELSRARRAGNELDLLYFEQLVQQYSDPAALDAQAALESGHAGGAGRLVIECDGDAELSLALVREQQRRLVPLPEQPLAERSVALAAGSYLLIAEVGTRHAVYPITIDAGAIAPAGARELLLEVRTAAIADLADDEVLVPGGPAQLGGPALLGASEPRRVDIAAFAMQRSPVTFAAYLEFIDDLRRRELPIFDDHTPRSALGAPYVKLAGERWSPAPAAGRLERDELLALPVFGVSAESAEAYARWLAERSGRAYRLPTEAEWEKAARGGDARAYPWGDQFDATFCKMRQSRSGVCRPEPPGRFPADLSAHGVRDLAGGIADWTAPQSGPTSGERITCARGGAWCDAAAACHAAARTPYLAADRSERVGFRLVRSVIL